MGSFWPSNSESDDEGSEDNNKTTPINYNTGKNLKSNTNINPKIPPNKVILSSSMNKNTNNFKEQIPQSLLNQKRIRSPEVQNDNNKEQPKTNQNAEIIKLNQAISEIIQENKKLIKENEQNKKIIENYSKKLENIEKEVQIKVNEALEKAKAEKVQNNEQIKGIIRNAMNKYKEENEEKLNEIISEIPQKMEENIKKKTKELEKLYYNNYKNKVKINKEIHYGIKCQKCLMEPIIGVRYKCSTCKNYNLCENCERDNSESNSHPHIFLKYIKKEEIPLNEEDYDNIKENNIINNKDIKNQNNNKNEKINNNNIFESHIKFDKNLNEFNNYSYECLTKELNFSVNEGTYNAKFNIILKNNGKFPWKKDKSFLICDESISDISLEKIKLQPLNPGEEFTNSLYFQNLQVLKPGIYKMYLNFNVDGKKYGENILINCEIVEKEKKVEFNPIIAGFRNKYQIDDKTMSDEVIKNALEKNGNNIDKAFQYLFQD